MPARSGAPEAQDAASRGKRLDSWKEIAGYLNRHVTTVRRWERQEGLPVHRHRHSAIGSIYAYARELDAWFESRREESDGPALVAGGRASSGAALVTPALLASRVGDSVALTGRDRELQLLADVWERACAGDQQPVLVTGEPGVGKTRLVFDFARSIASRATVLIGHCDREALVPYAPWVAILQWIIRTTPAELLRQRLSAIEGSSQLAQIVPDVAARVRVAEADAPMTPDGRRFRMFEAASELLTLTARDGPVLLVIDDLHWADRGTLLLLRHVLRTTRHASICIALTHREDVPEWPAEFRDLVETLRSEHAPTRIPLHRLSGHQVHRIIESWTGRAASSGLAGFVARHTEGNPLFVVEMLQHLAETGALERRQEWNGLVTLADVGLPKGIRDLIGGRLARVSQTTHRLLTVAAVIGREFPLSIIETLTDAGEDAALDAMDEALALGIVNEEPGQPGRFSFTHTLIRESLYTSITAVRRVRLHHRVATVLEGQASPRAPHLAELAYHFGQAAVYKSADKAFDYAIRAGDHDHSGLAFESAAHWYELALRAMDLLEAPADCGKKRVLLHVSRGRCFFAVGQWAAARNAFEAGLSLLDPDDLEKRCDLLVRLAETAFWLLDVPSLRRFALEARVLADRIGRDDLWANAQAWIASAMVSDGDVLEAVRIDRTAIARAGGIRSFALARTPLTLYWAGRTAEASRRALQAVEAARASDDPAFLLYALQHLGLILSGEGRYEEALSVFDEARAFGRRCGALPLLARATSMSVAPLLSLGDLSGAMTRALEAREIAHRAAFEPPLVSAGIDLLMIFARQRNPGAAETLLSETTDAVHKASGWHGWKWNMRLSLARAELALARHDWSDAVRAATDAVEKSQLRHRPKYQALGLIARARAAHQLGDRAAIKDARTAVTVSRRLADPAVLLESLFVSIEIDGRDTMREEVRTTTRAIMAGLSDDARRSTFLDSIDARAPRVVSL